MEVALDQSELHKVGFWVLEIQQWSLLLLLLEPLFALARAPLSIELAHDQDMQWPVSAYSIRVPTAHSMSSMSQRYPARFRVSPALNRCAKDA